MELDELVARSVVTFAAVLAIQDRFAEAFFQLMVRHMGIATGAPWDVRQVGTMPVGDISLSAKLYGNARQTAKDVTAIVRQQAQGVQQARALAIRLYDGYNPKDGIQRPLEGPARAQLPKALRNLTANATDRASLQRVYEQGMRYAATLKTEPLKAAYMKAFEGWNKQHGLDALERRLWVAHREKTRYMANRIAQTELARAHQHALADELVAYDAIDVVQLVLSGSHPKTDICDLHARADLFGLGPGCYPKAKAPRPTFHPFCRCRLRSRPDLFASDARERPGGARAYLRSLGKSEAARVMGSRGKLQAVLNGADPLAVVNKAVPEGYRTVRLGDLPSRQMSDAYKAAKDGGKHSRFLQQLPRLGDRQRRKSAESFQEQVDLHLDKIAMPEKYVQNWLSLRESHKASLLREWRKEMLDHREQIEILKGCENDL